MINRFFLAHPRLLHDEQKTPLRDNVFTTLNALLKEDFVISDEELLGESDFVQVHERVMRSELDWMLRNATGLSFLERLFLEATILHKFLVVYLKHCKTLENDEKKPTRTVQTLRAMIHQTLSLVLLQITPQFHQKLYTLGKLQSMDALEWKRAFVRASAFVRVAQAFSSIEDCQMFSPTLHEEIDFGMNLIVLDMRTRVAFGVMIRPGDPGGRFYVERVTHCPSSNATSIIGKQRRLIYQGTDKFNAHLKMRLTPVRILVGRPNNEPYDFTAYSEDARRINMIIDRVLSEPPQSHPFSPKSIVPAAPPH